jgi:hypothetical protein
VNESESRHRSCCDHLCFVEDRCTSTLQGEAGALDQSDASTWKNTASQSVAIKHTTSSADGESALASSSMFARCICITCDAVS